ncbi:MAG: hypothetical protein KAS02_02120 [Candidatus Pacebacteria bacterium]|nr:hypothetical protein [Candidatus Paceibacterota bacterium]
MKNLSQKIINRIKQEGIEPTPKWEFVLKNSFFWGAFGLAVIIGALSFSIIFHTLLNNDWDLHMQLSGGLTKFIIITLPYFWLILLTLFIVIAYINIRNTKKAYKYSLSMIIGGVILASFLLGITFYNLGLASSIDRNLIQKLPTRYHSILDAKAGLWQRPEKGFLSGSIDSLDGDILKLKDQNGDIWEVLLSEQILEIIPSFVLENDLKIKIMGEEIKEDCFGKCFYAEMLRPFDGPQDMIKGGMIDKKTVEEMNLRMQRIKPMLQGRIHENIKMLKI